MVDITRNEFTEAPPVSVTRMWDRDNDEWRPYAGDPSLWTVGRGRLAYSFEEVRTMYGPLYDKRGS